MPSLGGMAWKLLLQCRWDAAGNGCTVGLFAQPYAVPQDALFKFKYRIAAHCGDNKVAEIGPTGSIMISKSQGKGKLDIFWGGSAAAGLE